MTWFKFKPEHDDVQEIRVVVEKVVGYHIRSYNEDYDVYYVTLIMENGATNITAWAHPHQLESFELLWENIHGSGS